MYFEPQYSFAREILTKTIAMTSIMDDIYDVYGTFDELELFTKAIERLAIYILTHEHIIIFYIYKLWTIVYENLIEL